MVKIPKKELLEYWDAVSPYVLSFLQKREVTIEQIFDGFAIYRRHPSKGEKEFIYIADKDDILHWAYMHTYSFHPYICPIKGKGRCWFVLDLDPNKVKMDSHEFDNIKGIAKRIADFLNGKDLEFLAKFCGKNGFHFMWEWRTPDKPVEESVFKCNKKIIEEVLVYLLRLNLNIKLGTSDRDQLNSLKKAGFKVYGVKSADITLDAKIMHHHGNIRSPFSIHPATGWVSVPIVNEINEFKRKQAERAYLLQNLNLFEGVKLPVNEYVKYCGG